MFSFCDNKGLRKSVLETDKTVQRLPCPCFTPIVTSVSFTDPESRRLKVKIQIWSQPRQKAWLSYQQLRPIGNIFHILHKQTAFSREKAGCNQLV